MTKLYNKLGGNITTHCIRLQAVNAKLIYDGRGDYIFVDFSEYAAIIRGEHSEDDLKNKKQY